MKKYVLILVVLLSLLCIAASSKTDSCVTGKVLDRYESGGVYYLKLAEESVFVFTGKEVTVSVDYNFYLQTGINHLVTVCTESFWDKIKNIFQ